MAVPSFAAPYAAAWTKCPLFRAHSGRDGSPFADSHSNPAVSFVGVWRASVLLGLLRLEFEAAFAIGHRRSSAKMPTAPHENVNVWWECVELSPHHFRAPQAHALASRPEMALSRLDVYTAAHCIIRPILLFRKWEEVSRAILGVNMWWECVECYQHHFRAAQTHALASRPGHGAESSRRANIMIYI